MNTMTMSEVLYNLDVLTKQVQPGARIEILEAIGKGVMSRIFDARIELKIQELKGH